MTTATNTKATSTPTGVNTVATSGDRGGTITPSPSPLVSEYERLAAFETAVCAAVRMYGPSPGLSVADINLLVARYFALQEAIRSFQHEHKGISMSEIFKALKDLGAPVTSLTAYASTVEQGGGNTTLATPIGAGPVVAPVAPVVAPLPLATV